VVLNEAPDEILEFSLRRDAGHGSSWHDTGEVS
jgi:hypothetical protein